MINEKLSGRTKVLNEITKVWNTENNNEHLPLLAMIGCFRSRKHPFGFSEKVLSQRNGCLFYIPCIAYTEILLQLNIQVFQYSFRFTDSWTPCTSIGFASFYWNRSIAPRAILVSGVSFAAITAIISISLLGWISVGSWQAISAFVKCFGLIYLLGNCNCKLMSCTCPVTMLITNANTSS